MRLIYVLIFVSLSYGLFCQEYFQQEVNFEISVKLNDTDHSITAFEKIQYINNSQDTLEYLYFHLWPNAYKDKNTALVKQQIKYGNQKLYNAQDHERGYIDSLYFESDRGEIVLQCDREYEDICKLILAQPLCPGDTIHITTPFYVKIPDGKFSRIGHSGQSYQITQWYPKPAVYDQYGWHPMPYLDIGEFYSEFGTYKVDITIPDNYVVGATGNLLEAEEIERLNKIADRTAQIKSYNEDDNEFPASSEKLKTITFEEKNIHDFAWFADKRFHVLKGNIKLPGNGKEVTTWAMFTNYDARVWKNALEYINDALYYYSKWYGDYPYKNCTAVESASSAGGGMEYPTITLIGYSGNDLALEEVIMHEVGHNWFYGILGNNERAHPWMDEGINSFSELRYLNEKYPDLKLYKSMEIDAVTARYFGLYDLPHRSSYELSYLLNAKRNLDQAGNLHSEQYLTMNYFTIAYMKNAFSFNYLYNYLGEDLFDKIMQEYYSIWKFKHPHPDDLARIFNKHTDKDLSWFFNDLLGTTKKIDYKISRLSKNKTEGFTYQLKIKNCGSVKAPVSYSLIKNREIIQTKWLNGFNKKEKILIRENDFDLVMLDANGIIPDINKRNNYIKKKSLFKKWKPFELKLLGALDDPQKNQLYYFPGLGWNNNNGFMFGLAFYNNVVPMKRLEYQIIPLYATKNNNIAGTARAQYHLLPLKYFQRIDFSLSASQFALANNRNYQRIKGSTDFWIRNSSLSVPVENHLILSATLVSDHIQLYDYNRYLYRAFLDASFTHQNKRKINPYMYGVYCEGHNYFVKSWLEGKYKITYDKINKGLKIRLFAGYFLYHEEGYPNNYNFKLSGTTSWQDYKYDHIFFNRSVDSNRPGINSFFENQFLQNEGGFAVFSVMYSPEWMVSTNISTTLPALLPIEIYANIASFADIKKNYGDIAFYELGVSISFIDEAFEIFFPIAYSGELKNSLDYYYDNYLQKIRFTLNLNYIDPVKFIKNFRI